MAVRVLFIWAVVNCKSVEIENVLVLGPWNCNKTKRSVLHFDAVYSNFHTHNTVISWFTFAIWVWWKNGLTNHDFIDHGYLHWDFTTEHTRFWFVWRISITVKLFHHLRHIALFVSTCFNVHIIPLSYRASWSQEPTTLRGKNQAWGAYLIFTT